MQFSKLHGAGNDYVVVDGRDQDLDWPDWARRLSDRHFGVGADGLLVVTPSTAADVRMRMFNPDGSEAEMCGNGIRCFTKFVLERGLVTPGSQGLAVETPAGVMAVTPLSDNGRITRVRVEMGTPVLRASDVPVDPSLAGPSDLSRLDAPLLERLGIAPDALLFDAPVTVDGHTFDVTAVSTGNPHAVAFLDTPVAEIPLNVIGPLMEHHPAFPNRVNFHIVNVSARDRVVSRTWERGAGETLACGTGASALTVAARLHGFVEDTITVQVPGGELTVTWPGHGPVFMEGPVQEVFTGEWTA